MMTATQARLTPESLTAITAQVRPFTMAPDLAVHFTAMEAVRLIAAGIPGVLVECGTWRGGCSIAMLLAQQAVFGQVVRPVHLLDSSAGLPPLPPTVMVSSPGSGSQKRTVLATTTTVRSVRSNS